MEAGDLVGRRESKPLLLCFLLIQLILFLLPPISLLLTKKAPENSGALGKALYGVT
jgi:hypothetical protein